MFLLSDEQIAYNDAARKRYTEASGVEVNSVGRTTLVKSPGASRFFHIVARLLVTPDAGPGLGGPTTVKILAMACNVTQNVRDFELGNEVTCPKCLRVQKKEKIETVWERNERLHRESIASVGGETALDEAVQALLANVPDEYDIEAEITSRKTVIVAERKEMMSVYVSRGTKGLRRHKKRKRAAKRAEGLATIRKERDFEHKMAARRAGVCVKCAERPWSGNGRREKCPECLDRLHLNERDRVARVARKLRYERMARRYEEAKRGQYKATLQEATAALARKKRIRVGAEHVSPM